MRSIRVWARLLVVVVMALFVGGLAACTSNSTCGTGLPPDLPMNPDPCAKYCKVWVPPVYRDKPVLTQVRPPCTREKYVQVMEPRYRDLCIKPREESGARLPGKRCEQAVVQVRPGGYKWKRDGDCWRYCYEDPCYQWCNKVVYEEGIEYCTERPPEYKTVVTHEPTMKCKTEFVPGKYKVKWVKECWRPGHYEWHAQKECETCDCPAPSERIPFKKRPCMPPTWGCPTTN